jgi:hypothetical protein
VQPESVTSQPRTRLPNRRESETVRLELGGLRYFATVSRVTDGRLAEIFLDVGKPGSAIQHLARDLAVTASIALQYGAPASELRHALTRLDDGAAAGPLGALLDIVAPDGHSAGERA